MVLPRIEPPEVAAHSRQCELRSIFVVSPVSGLGVALERVVARQHLVHQFREDAFLQAGGGAARFAVVVHVAAVGAAGPAASVFLGGAGDVLSEVAQAGGVGVLAAAVGGGGGVPAGAGAVAGVVVDEQGVVHGAGFSAGVVAVCGWSVLGGVCEGGVCEGGWWWLGLGEGGGEGEEERGERREA